MDGIDGEIEGDFGRSRFHCVVVSSYFGFAFAFAFSFFRPSSPHPSASRGVGGMPYRACMQGGHNNKA